MTRSTRCSSHTDSIRVPSKPIVPCKLWVSSFKLQEAASPTIAKSPIVMATSISDGVSTCVYSRRCGVLYSGVILHSVTEKSGAVTIGLRKDDNYNHWVQHSRREILHVHSKNMQITRVKARRGFLGGYCLQQSSFKGFGNAYFVHTEIQYGSQSNFWDF